MILNNIPNPPPLLDTPVYSFENAKLTQWAVKLGGELNKDGKFSAAALCKAIGAHSDAKNGFNDEGFEFKVGLIGHAYNVLDSFVNMDIKNKLNALGLGVMTSEHIPREYIDDEVKKLFKKPFWTYAQEYYGAAVGIFRKGLCDGIIYLSSFSCGVDSVVTELIKNEIGDFPFMVLKLDEHTGEAGFNTRIEAFSDLLKRRRKVGTDLS
jgi:predicted nucleotide-binding protein (sugar kinase/HSP70/actin superfamily)